MSFEPREFLRHIKTEADYLLRRSRGTDRDAFLADDDLRRAFARSLEIIGEAAKRVPDDFFLNPEPYSSLVPRPSPPVPSPQVLQPRTRSTDLVSGDPTPSNLDPPSQSARVHESLRPSARRKPALRDGGSLR